MYAETCELYAFVDVECSNKAALVASCVTQKEQDGRGDVEDEEVDDDHIQDPSRLGLVFDNEMKPGIKNDRLTSDHAIPANTRQDAEDEVRTQAVVPQQDDDAVENYTERRRDHAPEIQAFVSFKSAEERYEDLETVVAGYGEEACDGHVHGERGRDGPCLPGTRHMLSCHD